MLDDIHPSRVNSYAKCGEPIKELCVNDEDVPPSLREVVVRMENTRVMRNEQRERRTAWQAVRVGADNMNDEDEFFGAESSGIQDLFGGDRDALKFEWSPMATFSGQPEKFLPENPGPTEKFSCIYGAFRKYWDDEILEHIARETNRYAAEIALVSERFARDWYETNVHEILILFAFWMMLGVIRMPTINSCFSNRSILKTCAFRTLMTQGRYWLLNRALHFADNSQRSGMLKSTEVVVRLMRPLLNKGHRLFMDNWFNSPVLARFLKRNKTDCVGTLRKCRTYIPPLIQLVTLTEGSCVARHSGDVVVMAYHDKGPVTTISTIDGTESVHFPGKPESVTKIILLPDEKTNRPVEKELKNKPYFLEMTGLVFNPCELAMNALRMHLLKHQEGFFRFYYNILNIHRLLPITAFPTTVDVIDAYTSGTSESILQHRDKMKNNINMPQFSIQHCNRTDTKTNDVILLPEQEFETTLQELLIKNKDKQIEIIILQCLSIRRLLSDSILKTLLKHYSNAGKPELIVIIQKYFSRLLPNSYRRNGEFSHYLAKAQCLKGNSEKGLSILRDGYKKNQNLRSLYRVIFRELIHDSVMNRSEASLVVFKKYVLEFSKLWEEHYPLVCFWHICWLSSWYSDQMLSNELDSISAVHICPEGGLQLRRRREAAADSAEAQYDGSVHKRPTSSLYI
ncbi:Uncharacterized protein OBRU01_18735 [Operophtera brumata]|uniref:PiggyBac transposable element-derived protein domain-containing protein n=1 Tax=Operophtera brumata TaxID=104452 RepID=A0A0L7KXQ3_OPEBR|nr:Uncharacterized protein OBRU01_18735 [Operophtera brumata]